MKKKSDDNDSDIDKSHSSLRTESDEVSEIEENYDIPAKDIFPSFVTCVLWGPFANETDRFPLFSLDDAVKTTVVSRE